MHITSLCYDKCFGGGKATARGIHRARNCANLYRETTGMSFPSPSSLRIHHRHAHGPPGELITGDMYHEDITARL